MIDHYAAMLFKVCAMFAFLVFGSPAHHTDGLAVETVNPPAETQRSVLLPGGVRLRYLEQGPPDGPVALLLHGYTDSGESYGRVLPLMPAQARIVVLDQRGHGASDRPDGPYTVDQLASDALAVLDALKVPDAVVVGHSMGSFVARRMAELAPNRVRGLILLGSAPVPVNAATQDLLATVETLGDPVDEGFVRSFQESSVARPVPPAFMDRAIANSRTMPARIWRGALRGLLDYVPSKIPPACPTLVLGGREDAVFSGDAQRALAAAIPHARLVLVDGIGHSLHWEDPERFAREFTRFFEGTTC